MRSDYSFNLYAYVARLIGFDTFKVLLAIGTEGEKRRRGGGGYGEGGMGNCDHKKVTRGKEYSPPLMVFSPVVTCPPTRHHPLGDHGASDYADMSSAQSRTTLTIVSAK